MADILDIFGFGNLPPGRGSIIGGFPEPGGFSIGGIANEILQRIPLPRPRLPRQLPPGPRGPTTTGPTFPFPVPIPFPSDIFGGGGQALCETGPASNPCCRGQHLNKSMDCAGNPPGTKCVTNRRMNPLNSRALKRATRRLKGFERAVKGTRKQLRSLAKI